MQHKQKTIESLRSLRALGVALSMVLLLPTLAAAEMYDNGRLETSYFGQETMRFVETEEIDYLWVADGVELQGKSFHFVEWSDPEFLGPKANERDQDDRRLARQMNSDMHLTFAETWDGMIGDTSTDEGEIRVEGRIVDVSTGNRAAKLIVGFGAGAGSTVIDLKFIDTASGDVVAAIHHRAVSGTSWSTTNSKFYKWIKKAGKELGSKGFQKAYMKGNARKD